MRFLIDENLPFSLIRLLQESGHDVFDVAASALRSSPDETLWRFAARQKRILVTKDLDFPFPHIRPYPLGLILIRVPDTFTGRQITRLFSNTLESIKPKNFESHITVIAPGQIRSRRLE